MYINFLQLTLANKILPRRSYIYIFFVFILRLANSTFFPNTHNIVLQLSHADSLYELNMSSDELQYHRASFVI